MSDNRNAQQPVILNHISQKPGVNIKADQAAAPVKTLIDITLCYRHHPSAKTCASV